MTAVGLEESASTELSDRSRFPNFLASLECFTHDFIHRLAHVLGSHKCVCVDVLRSFNCPSFSFRLFYHHDEGALLLGVLGVSPRPSVAKRLQEAATVHSVLAGNVERKSLARTKSFELPRPGLQKIIGLL